MKEKAKKLRGSLSTDILSTDGSISTNIVAITFRQVVLQRLWSFELSVFCPGSERNMDELAEPKDVSTLIGFFASAILPMRIIFLISLRISFL